MSLPRPSGLKAPSKIGKPTGLPQPKGTGIPTPGSATRAQSPDLLIPPPPADDFIIGDRVWVGGTKPGYIAFIGETQFAAGEWAGVVLDKAEGKNDGAVQGVRYFQCEPKRGVFARISKLSRTPGVLSVTPKPDDAVSDTGANSVKATNGTVGLSHTTSRAQARPTTPKLSLSSTRGLSTSSSSLNKSSPPTSSLNLVHKSVPSPASKGALKKGDRVLVSGTKTGTLRYIGETDFAKGEWAGVELDEKQGKNDGAVSGKRYFECRPMFGLFAPVHKVAKLTSGAGNPTSTSTPSPQTRSLMNTSLRMSRERSGSQESVSSISSTASSVSRSRVRLGVNSLGNQAKTSQRPSTLNLTATTQALQKALKEKEEHIEQLLRERDLERAEVARAAAQVDEAEGQLTQMKNDQEKLRGDADEILQKLKSKINDLEQEKADLNCKLEDEKRKVEDLQFQIEEEAITKDDLESRTEEKEAILADLERNVKKEKDRADKFEQEFYTLKAMLKDQTDRLSSTEEMNTTYLDQIEELTHKLSQAESKVKSYESTRLEEGAKSSQVSIELVEKSNRVNELEDILSNRDSEIKELQFRLREVDDNLNSTSIKKQKMQETIDNLSAQLTNRDEASNNLNTEIQKLKSQLSDLQRRLESSEESNKEIKDEKLQLEQQMSEMMKNSGDSSNRLSMLNEQVQEKNRKIQDLQTALSNSTQQLGKLNDEIENLKRETIKERENLISNHEEAAKNYQSQLEDLQRELSKATTNMHQLIEDHHREKEDSLSRKIREIEDLKKQLQASIEEQEKQEVQTQAHKQVLEQITMEKEALKFEKEKVEKQVKRLESEKETINTELIHARVEVSKIQSELEKVSEDRDQVKEQISEVKTALEKASSTKNELQKQIQDGKKEKDQLTEERDSLQQEKIKTKATLQQKDMLIEELQKEADKLKTEIGQQEETLSQLSQQESSSEVLEKQLEQSKQSIAEMQKSMTEIEGERDSMKAQLEFSNLVAEERRRLEDQNQQLTKEADKLAERKEKEELENSNTTLKSELENTSHLLKQQTNELESLKQQISNLKNENSSLEGYRLSAQKVENEKKELHEKIKTLEGSLQEAKSLSDSQNNIDTSENSALAKVNEEKEAMKGQVDFLNSVIVDLQKKNQDLTTRLEVMESGVVTNGDADSSMEAETPKRPPPRLFCDICDMFDKHDTDDCPLQAMDYDEDEPSPSHHHGDRKATRPYCDICEEFHAQSDCDKYKSEISTKSLPQIIVGNHVSTHSISGGKTNPLDVLFKDFIKGSSSPQLQNTKVLYRSSSDSVEIDTDGVFSSGAASRWSKNKNAEDNLSITQVVSDAVTDSATDYHSYSCTEDTNCATTNKSKITDDIAFLETSPGDTLLHENLGPSDQIETCANQCVDGTAGNNGQNGKFEESAQDCVIETLEQIGGYEEHQREGKGREHGDERGESEECGFPEDEQVHEQIETCQGEEDHRHEETGGLENSDPDGINLHNDHTEIGLHEYEENTNLDEQIDFGEMGQCDNSGQAGDCIQGYGQERCEGQSGYNGQDNNYNENYQSGENIDRVKVDGDGGNGDRKDSSDGEDYIQESDGFGQDSEDAEILHVGNETEHGKVSENEETKRHDQVCDEQYSSVQGNLDEIIREEGECILSKVDGGKEIEGMNENSTGLDNSKEGYQPDRTGCLQSESGDTYSPQETTTNGNGVKNPPSSESDYASGKESISTDNGLESCSEETNNVTAESVHVDEKESNDEQNEQNLDSNEDDVFNDGDTLAPCSAENEPTTPVKMDESCRVS